MIKRYVGTTLIAFTAIVFSIYGAGCGSGSSGPKLTPEQKTGATAVCQKAGDCSGGISSSQMSDCQGQIAGALQLFPDPDKFAVCINAMSCSQLENASSTDILGCLDLNRDSYECSDSSTLTGCNNAGKCASAPCSDVCTLMNATFDHCGPSNDSSKAKNICWCRQ